MRSFKIILAAIVFFSIYLSCQAQEKQSFIVTKAKIINGDTIPVVDLESVTIVGPRIFKSKREAIKYTKLIRDVKKTYPYAKLAGIKLRQYNEILIKTESKSEQRKIMRQAEKELKEEFEDDIRKMTFKQGIILLKLIDRETGDTSYAIVKELRGMLTAFFWQSVGRIFGINLKTEYKPKTKDKHIEEIVIMIENGTV